jgi:hypothetical protein
LDVRFPHAVGSQSWIGQTLNAFDEHREFAQRVESSRLVDPLPAFEALSAETGVPAGDLVHYALVRWVSAGSEALLAVRPQVLDELIAAREAEDWKAVAGIVDWIAAGR